MTEWHDRACAEPEGVNDCPSPQARVAAAEAMAELCAGAPAAVAIGTKLSEGVGAADMLLAFAHMTHSVAHQLCAAADMDIEEYWKLYRGCAVDMLLRSKALSN